MTTRTIHALRILAIILTSLSVVASAALALGRSCGAVDLAWPVILSPLLFAGALWSTAALIVVLVLWFMVRIGKDIP